ncbi:MAG TPA: chemotaxis-specific protein-glutamate methyltransferase CheB [Polyangiaceae bacterium]|jgi:two-component system chemotaxis response regulator CheB|nr:chemotaxis-specific protein-glutamate methyltransferase CheB [Polyangiaceae bacterium]
MTTRVLVVDDSVTVRKHIVGVLSADPDVEVIAEAGDGKRAIELCQALRPDVVTLDMMLPVMSGLAATEFIMAYCPTPILIVSASTNRGELFKTYEALAAGALDVLDKPTGTAEDDDWGRKLVSSVKLVARLKVITHPRARLGSLSQRAPHGPTRQSATSSATPSAPLRAVALGASTGGPGALVEILKRLPSTFPLPILLVLHLGEPFAEAFASWLDGQSALRVAYARDGDPLPEVGTSRVIVASPDRHLVLERGRLWQSADPPRHSCRPSVDVLFESLATELGPAVAACLLTGMGRDGASGLLAVRAAGGRTIAQDEATSVVFGMPREAILLGAAEQVLPVTEIARVLVSMAELRQERSP